MAQSVCAPNNVNVSSHWTCFSHSELVSIATAFNEFYKTTRKRIETDVPKKQLWYEIYNRLSDMCKFESCWVDLKFVNAIKNKALREHLKYFVFKPKMSKHSSSWLGTEDINFVMSQYAAALPFFKFLGAQPSDIYNLVPFNLGKYKNDYRFVGVVFNHDKHTQPGSHWVALLVDNANKTIEYFDSLGSKPPKLIIDFIKRTEKRMPGYTVKINKKTHQLENSECGVYSMFFIIRRILGDSFSSLTGDAIRDSAMRKFRKYIFRPDV